jgi:hypothetical protein
MQPSRPFAFGALTNHRYIRIIRASREADDWKRFRQIAYTVVYNGEFKESWIQWLRESPLATLGVVHPKVLFDNTEYVLHSYLGSGQFCHAYSVNVDGVEVVVKHYHDAKQARKEKDIFEGLKDCDHVSHLYKHQPAEEQFIAVTPHAHKFSSQRPVNKTHVSQLILALNALHNLKKVHGDVCASNIYFIDSKHAMLNDWSHVRDSENIYDRRMDFKKLQDAVRAVGGTDVDDEISRILVATDPDAAQEPASKKSRAEC